MKKLLALLILLAGPLYAQHTRFVIVVVIDGVRYTESYGDSTHQWIPRIWTDLKPQGAIYTSFSNAGVTTTNPGHANIVTGAWQTITNDGLTRPHTPTVFEYSRKSLGTGADKNFVVLGKTKLNILAYSDHPDYGPSFGASVASAPSELVDELAADTLKQVLRTYHPALTVLNLPHTDSVAHGGSWDGYVSSLRNADSLVYDIWNAVQNDSVMKGKTTMFVTNDHGRHTTLFTDHEDGCEGCRHIMLLAIGPDTPPGVIDSMPRFQVDIAPTIGVLLGFGTPFATGKILSSAIANFSYAHDVVLAQPFRDSLRITAQVVNPMAHALTVMVTLRDDRGSLIDSVALKDDGLHGDGAANDGTWGCMYAPGPDGTLRASIRTDDPTAGTSSSLADVAQFAFTRGALIALDHSTIDFGRIANTLQARDTTFVVRNSGFAPDSLTISIDPVNVVPDTAVAVFPTAFYLAAKDSQMIRFSVWPQLLVPQYYTAGITVVPKAGMAQTALLKAFLFEIVIAGGIDYASRFPKELALHQNYPNPFNPSTTIQYSLPVRSHVILSVFNTLGQLAAELVHGEIDAGHHVVRFEASGLSSGVYFYRIQVRPLDSVQGRDSKGGAGDFVRTRKLLVMK